MYPSSNLSQGSVAYRVPRVASNLMLLALGCWGVATLVRVTPGILRHFMQPCAGCYLGAFEPPLEPYRTLVKQPSATSQTADHGHWLVLETLTAAEQTSLSGANGVGQGATMPRWHEDGGMKGEFHAIAESRGYAREFTTFAATSIGRGWVDDPMAAQTWTGVSIGRIAVARLNVASIPGAANLVDGLTAPVSLAPNAPSIGVPQVSDVQSGTGVPQTVRTSWGQGTVPYWRVAVQKNLQQHFLQIGTYGMTAGQSPAGGQSADRFAAADANYQFIFGPGSGVTNILSARSIVLHEIRSLDASARTNNLFMFDTFRAGMSWGIADTITPSIQYFRSGGSIEAMQFLWPGTRPNSAGLIAGVTYVPWHGAGSPMQFLNLRLAAQYVSYTEVNGNAHGASEKNSVSFGLLGALRF